MSIQYRSNFNFRYFSVLSIILLLFSINAGYAASQPVNLRVDYIQNPIGIDNHSPGFSWQIKDARMGAKQTAWQIQVASTPQLLKIGKADIWDSGQILSAQTRQIIYSGKPLKSSTRYFWNVKIWDQNNKPGKISETAFFETAYLDSSDWKGDWITNTEDTTSQYSPYFRKTFETHGKIIRATAYVAGVGYHELYVNGQKASESLLEPNYTRFDRHVLYLTYDVTRFLSEGNNCLGVILGNGWYNVQTKAVWNFDKAPWRKSPRLLMNLCLHYADGSVKIIPTDESWKYSEGPIRFNSLYAGEEYDARLELNNWGSPGYDDSKWLPVIKTSAPGGVLAAQQSPSVKIIRNIKPVSIYKIGNGKYLYDMGQNFAGVASLKISGLKGTKIKMRFGERINPDHSLDAALIAKFASTKNDELPFQTDIYILKGNGVETYAPRFTYHGYQYVEVTAEPAMDLTISNLEGLFLSTDFETAGSFKCSNDLMNKLYSASLQSYRSNFLSIPTDCPQREKNGWTADAHISCESGLWNYDGFLAYRKWLQDFRDAQKPDGELPGIVPTSGWGYDVNPAWDAALPVITWELFRYYGDTLIIKENYTAIKRYLDFLSTQTQNGIQTEGLDDWLSITKTPVEITSTAYYFYDALTLSNMARILGKADDENKYAALADSIKTIFNNTFYDPVERKYKIQTQTALSCVLYQGLNPMEAANQTATDLIKQIEMKDFHPDFGLLGSKYVFNALHNSGNDEIAYKILNSAGYPGWEHWIASGATTLYEDWGGAESLNHVFFCDFCSWFVKALGGIQIDPAYPGFDSFIIAPSFINELSFVNCSYNSINGTIYSGWKRTKEAITWNVIIPPNTKAAVIIPDSLKIEKVMHKDINIGLISGSNKFTLEAGDYIIKLKQK
jgi:alpha-L-rhamnosidase